MASPSLQGVREVGGKFGTLWNAPSLPVRVRRLPRFVIRGYLSFLELPLYRPFFGTLASTNCLVLQLLLILLALLTVLLLGRLALHRNHSDVRIPFTRAIFPEEDLGEAYTRRLRQTPHTTDAIDR